MYREKGIFFNYCFQNERNSFIWLLCRLFNGCLLLLYNVTKVGRLVSTDHWVLEPCPALGRKKGMEGSRKIFHRYPEHQSRVSRSTDTCLPIHVQTHSAYTCNCVLQQSYLDWILPTLWHVGRSRRLWSLALKAARNRFGFLRRWQPASRTRCCSLIFGHVITQK